MLVSAAIDPYRNSCGKARRSSPMLPGSIVAARKTASPRKTCVPGVHAHAVSGTRSSNPSLPATTNHGRRTLTNHVRRTGRSDPKLLALTTNRLPKTVELGVHELIDHLARGVEVVVQA